MQTITSNGIMVRTGGEFVTAGAVATYGNGGTFGQSNGALVLLKRAGEAVEASQRIRDYIANSPAFGETFTSDYARVAWPERACLDMLASGASIDDMAEAFGQKETDEWTNGKPKAAQPRKKDMERAVREGQHAIDALMADMVMKDRVADAMHNAKRAKIAPDVVRFKGWLALIVERSKRDAGKVSAPPSNRAMRRMVRQFISDVQDGVSIMSAIKTGLDTAIVETASAALAQQPNNAASNPDAKPLPVRSVPVSIPQAGVPVYVPFTPNTAPKTAKRTVRKAK